MKYLKREKRLLVAAANKTIFKGTPQSIVTTIIDYFI